MNIKAVAIIVATIYSQAIKAEELIPVFNGKDGQRIAAVGKTFGFHNDKTSESGLVYGVFRMYAKGDWTNFVAAASTLECPKMGGTLYLYYTGEDNNKKEAAALWVKEGETGYDYVARMLCYYAADPKDDKKSVSKSYL
jgi:hypothetical protein